MFSEFLIEKSPSGFITWVCSKKEAIAAVKYFEYKKVNFVWYYNSMVLITWFVVFNVLCSNLVRTIKPFFNQITVS